MKKDNQPEDKAHKPPEKAPATGVPADARWTKLDRKLVSPEALATGNDQYEVRKDHILVFRPLKKQEIERYANLTLEMKEEANRTGEAELPRVINVVDRPTASSVDQRKSPSLWQEGEKTRPTRLEAGASMSTDEDTFGEKNLGTDNSGTIHRCRFRSRS